MTDETTALEIIPKESALQVLTDPEQFDAFFERVAEQVRGVAPDLTTSAGRKAVAALAFKVTKSKTAIVAAADLLTEDARAQIKKVNESKKAIEERLDALKVEVRKPLTDWEQAEEERLAKVAAMNRALTNAAIVSVDDTAAVLTERLTFLEGIPLDAEADVYGDHLPIMQALRDTAATNVRNGIERATRAEADAAELAALREQTAERDRQDAERQAQERRDQEARDAEAARAEEARQAEERRKEEERQAAERQRVAAEQAQAREREVAENAAAAERQRIADEAEAKRAADEKRAANVKHQGKIMGEAKVAIMRTFPVAMSDADKETFAKAIVSAIVAGVIPHTAINC